MSEISAQGAFNSSGANTGAIYQIRFVGMSTAVVEVVGEAIPHSFSLDDAYPNPFNPTATLRFAVPETAGALAATLTIYDVAGQTVRTLVDESVAAGVYEAMWDGTDEGGRAVASGTYIYELRVGNVFASAKRMTLLK